MKCCETQFEVCLGYYALHKEDLWKEMTILEKNLSAIMIHPGHM